MGKANHPSDLGQPFSAGRPAPKVMLKLFVAGLSLRSQATIDVLVDLCEKYLPGNYQIEIIDIYQQPEMARQQQIIATPTLVRYHPQPKKTMIGDLTRTERALACLGITG